MVDFWSFNDTIFLAKENWVWLLVALGLGLCGGWISCSREERS